MKLGRYLFCLLLFYVLVNGRLQTRIAPKNGEVFQKGKMGTKLHFQMSHLIICIYIQNVQHTRFFISEKVQAVLAFEEKHGT